MRGVGADDRVELMLGGIRVGEAGDERLERVVDNPPAGFVRFPFVGRPSSRNVAYG